MVCLIGGHRLAERNYRRAVLNVYYSHLKFTDAFTQSPKNVV